MTTKGKMAGHAGDPDHLPGSWLELPWAGLTPARHQPIAFRAAMTEEEGGGGQIAGPGVGRELPYIGR
jgi:hypothetical protein